MTVLRAGANLFLKLLGITFFVYVILYVTPGSSIESLQRGKAVKERIAGDMIAGYLNWAGNALRGDMGHCEGTPVVERLRLHVPRTLLLVGGSLTLSLVLALGMAVISLQWSNFAVQNLISLANLISGLHIIVLSFVVIIMGWVIPNTGFSPWLLVVLALGNGTLVDYYAVIRTQIAQALVQDYVVAATGRGASRLRHAVIYEIVLGLVEATSSRVPALIGGTIIVEWIFSYLGLGFDIVKAIQVRSFDLIMGVSTVVAALLIFLMETTDLVRRRLDPKLEH